MAEVGGEAGLAADYWDNGFYFHDGETGARVIVEQDGPNPIGPAPSH